MVFRTLFLAAALLVGQAVCVSEAKADTIIRCDDCLDPGPQWWAEQGPNGWTYVVDYNNVGITLWYVTSTTPHGPKTATQYEVDDKTYLRFVAMMEAKTEQQMSANGEPIVINITPGGYYGLIFGSEPFGGFSNSNAYEVVQSQNVRNMLGQNLAQAMSITNTQNSNLNALGITLNSFIMSMGFPSSFKIIITWNDGSKTTMLIDSSSAGQAKYVPGESKTPNGLPIPDASAQSPEAGEIYQGQYDFQGDAQSLEQWLNALQMAGVPITGPRSDQIVCTWDGQELNCHFQ